jgi:hypothetical protein
MKAIYMYITTFFLQIATLRTHNSTIAVNQTNKFAKLKKKKETSEGEMVMDIG